MEYVDNLKDFLEVVGDKSVAEMGINHKNARKKKFHVGHELVIDTLLKLDADIKLVKLSVLSEDGRDKLNLEYCKEYLEEAGIDIFYYMDRNDLEDNWFPKMIDEYTLGKMIKPFKIRPDYWTWAGMILLSDQLYYRKYWVGSSKDKWRKPFGEFCKQYTRIQPVIVTRIKL